ncbi:hypothetical protein C5B42_01470 [Candidatus Cerribacteria bacterium 'Amazon FNV 2010 28 9']|uniref:Uncharacterized protein n=1 Tax=Candidatus Cerribacteria bacterium 'Amazon FNV 2010 28 9' TaxID=2081795 RepID=A0A317JPM9_9BACT|nr:MAG: hypothetical protein C5B42_01470 [Candidatus Cerribacteria bacterium 'Amazon FNV 2010 28 9']
MSTISLPLKGKPNEHTPSSFWGIFKFWSPLLLLGFVGGIFWCMVMYLKFTKPPSFQMNSLFDPDVDLRVYLTAAHQLSTGTFQYFMSPWPDQLIFQYPPQFLGWMTVLVRFFSDKEIQLGLGIVSAMCYLASWIMIWSMIPEEKRRTWNARIFFGLAFVSTNYLMNIHTGNMACPLIFLMVLQVFATSKGKYQLAGAAGIVSACIKPQFIFVWLAILLLTSKRGAFVRGSSIALGVASLPIVFFAGPQLGTLCASYVQFLLSAHINYPWWIVPKGTNASFEAYSYRFLGFTPFASSMATFQKGLLALTAVCGIGWVRRQKHIDTHLLLLLGVFLVYIAIQGSLTELLEASLCGLILAVVQTMGNTTIRWITLPAFAFTSGVAYFLPTGITNAIPIIPLALLLLMGGCLLTIRDTTIQSSTFSLTP